MLQGPSFGHRLDLFHLESHHAKFQLNPFRNGWDIGCLEFLWGGGVGWGGVDTDALPSSSPSLIWLSWGFGLAWAVTIAILGANYNTLVHRIVNMLVCNFCSHFEYQTKNLKEYFTTDKRKYSCTVILCCKPHNRSFLPMLLLLKIWLSYLNSDFT